MRERDEKEDGELKQAEHIYHGFSTTRSQRGRPRGLLVEGTVPTLLLRTSVCVTNRRPPAARLVMASPTCATPLLVANDLAEPVKLSFVGTPRFELPERQQWLASRQWQRVTLLGGHPAG